MGIALAMNTCARGARGDQRNIDEVDYFARAICPVFFSVLFAFFINGSHPMPLDYILDFYINGTTRRNVVWLAWNLINDPEGTRKRALLPEG